MLNFWVVQWQAEQMNVAQIKELVSENRYIIICELPNKLGISFELCQSILTQSPPQQCSCLLYFICVGISDQEWHNFSSPSLLPDLAPCNFSFSETQVGIKEKKIWWHHHNSKTIIGNTCQVQNTGLLQMSSTVMWMLGSLYQVTRELLHRGQHGTVGKCCYLRGKRSTIQTFLSDHVNSSVKYKTWGLQTKLNYDSINWQTIWTWQFMENICFFLWRNKIYCSLDHGPRKKLQSPLVIVVHLAYMCFTDYHTSIQSNWTEQSGNNQRLVLLQQ